MSRETFLARVREAVRAGNQHRPEMPEIAAEAGYVGAGDDLCAAMASEVNEVGGVATLCNDWEQATSRFRELCQQHRVKRVLCWQHSMLDQLKVGDVCQQGDIDVLNNEKLAQLDLEEQRQLALSADMGITSVDYAIAETGTCGLKSTAGREKMASLLPPVYVTIIHQSQIVPDLIDVFNDLEQGGLDNLPSNMTFITGPSKTGDIELTLVTGVHGPGTWYVIIVRE